jgi:hypothetical protein
VRATGSIPVPPILVIAAGCFGIVSTLLELAAAALERQAALALERAPADHG